MKDSRPKPSKQEKALRRDVHSLIERLFDKTFCNDDRLYSLISEPNEGWILINDLINDTKFPEISQMAKKYNILLTDPDNNNGNNSNSNNINNNDNITIYTSLTQNNNNNNSFENLPQNNLNSFDEYNEKWLCKDDKKNEKNIILPKNKNENEKNNNILAQTDKNNENKNETEAKNKTNENKIVSPPLKSLYYYISHLNNSKFYEINNNKTKIRKSIKSEKNIICELRNYFELYFENKNWLNNNNIHKLIKNSWLNVYDDNEFKKICKNDKYRLNLLLKSFENRPLRTYLEGNTKYHKTDNNQNNEENENN